MRIKKIYKELCEFSWSWRFFPLFLVAGFAVYWNSLHSEFLGDDYARIYDSALQIFQKGLEVTLAELLPDRPFLTFTIWLNWRMFGLSYFAFKVINIAIHCLAGFALFKLLNTLSRRHFGISDERFAAVLGILFVVHPVASQSINQIIQRGVLLAGFFAITSMLFFIRFLDSRQMRDYLFCFLALLLGMLSKPFVITLPLIFAAYVILMYREISVKTLAKWIMPLMILALIPSLFLFILKSNTQNSALGWSQYLIVQTRVIFIYFRLFLFPFNLHYLYNIAPEAEILKNLTWLAILGHIGILVVAKLLIKKKPLVAFSIFATYLALLSESGAFPIDHLAFEHRSYFPYIFLFIGVWALIVPLQRSARRISMAVIITIIFIFSWICVERNRETNTFLKWSLSILDYNSNDQIVNLRLIELLQRYDNTESVKKITNTLLEKYPNHALYILWKKTVDFQTAPPNEKKNILEFIARVLIENAKKNSSVGSCLFFNRFIISHIYEVADDVQASLLIENVLASQESRFTNDPEVYISLIKMHATVLKFLRSYYEKKILAKEQLAEPEAVRYRHILENIDKYFNTKEPSLKAK